MLKYNYCGCEAAGSSPSLYCPIHPNNALGGVFHVHNEEEFNKWKVGDRMSQFDSYNNRKFHIVLNRKPEIVAQMFADMHTDIQRAREEAKKIAKENPGVEYFVFTVDSSYIYGGMTEKSYS